MTLAHLLVTQIAYAFAAAIADSGACYRCHSFNNGAGRTWTPWISNSAVAVGTVALFPATVAPPGYLKLNGALL